MAQSTRSLIYGLVAGVFLALLLQHLFTSSTQLPSPILALGSTLAALGDSQAGMSLRNSLQIPRALLRRGGTTAVSSGYKRAGGLAASSELLKQFTTPSPLASTSTASTRPFSTSLANMSDKKTFLEAVEARRTIYALNKNPPISDKEIVELAKKALLHVPSSFNSQSTRLVVLLNEEHNQFWDFTLEILKTIVPADQLPSTEGRIAGFRGGYGTILFFEDPEPVRKLEEAFPIYAHHFGPWSSQTSAMHQYALWVAFEAEGFGANLQHYNPIVDQKVQEHWKVPLEWKLIAQLVIGGRAGDPGEKTFKPVEGERLFVHGAKN